MDDELAFDDPVDDGDYEDEMPGQAAGVISQDEIEAEIGDELRKVRPGVQMASPRVEALQALAHDLGLDGRITFDQGAFWLRVDLDSPVWLGGSLRKAKRTLRGLGAG